MTDVSLKDYFAQAGSRFTDADAKVIGPVLAELETEGGVSPETVVDAARSTNSPLHRYFEWDDVKAAHLYRLDQATTMIRVVKVRDKDFDGGGHHAYRQRGESISQSNSWRSYKTMTDETRAADAAASALMELLIWRKKFSPYLDMWKDFGKAFGAVASQIGEMEAECGGADPDVVAEAIEALTAWRKAHEAQLLAWGEFSEQAQFMFDAIKEAEKSFAATAVKPRTCMRCGEIFVSQHAGNRLCTKCEPIVSAAGNGIEAHA